MKKQSENKVCVKICAKKVRSGGRVQSLKSLMKYGIPVKDENKFRLIEINESFLELSRNQWKYEDMIACGHKPLELRLYPSCGTIPRHSIKTREINPLLEMTNKVKEMLEQYYSLIKVTDSSSKYFNQLFNDILLAEGSVIPEDYTIPIQSLITEDLSTGTKYRWQRVKVPTTSTKNDSKIILTQVGGVLVSQLEETKQESLLETLGRMTMQIMCKIGKQRGEDRACCEGYSIS